MCILLALLLVLTGTIAQAQSLPSVIYVGAIDVDPGQRSPAELGFGVDLNTELGDDTSLSVFYLHGANPGILRAFRYGLHSWRGYARLDHRDWRVTAGEIRTDRKLFGPSVVGDGLSVARESGLVIGSITVTQPKYFTGSRGGHLVETTLGLRTRRMMVRGFASDVMRISPRSLVLAGPVDLPEDDAEVTLGDLEELGALLPRRHRIRTAGLDSQVRLGRHTVTSRGAFIEQENEAAQRVAGPAFETQYAYADPRASVTASIRRSPRTLPGVELAGNLGSVSTKVRIVRTLKAVARGHVGDTLPFGRSEPTHTRGGSAGLEYGRRLMRVDLLANYRDARSIAMRRTRTLSTSFRIPAGRVTGEGRVEVGQADEGRRVMGVALYRVGLNVDADPAGFMVTATYQDYGVLPPRLRADVSASLEWRGVSAEFGVGGGRSQLLGDDVGAWGNVEIPLPGALTFQFGVDYDRWLYATSRYITFVPDAADLSGPWRLTATVRKELRLSHSK